VPPSTTRAWAQGRYLRVPKSKILPKQAHTCSSPNNKNLKMKKKNS